LSELTHEDVKKILAIIDSMGDRSVSLDIGDIKLQVTRGGAAAAPASMAAPMQPARLAAAPTPAAPKAAPAAIPEGMVAVEAPSSGTFYRAPSPNAEPFVEVGDRVEANDTVGVFDVMKLFMSLSAGVKGTVTAILVGNQSVCEQGQALVLLKPD